MDKARERKDDFILDVWKIEEMEYFVYQRSVPKPRIKRNTRNYDAAGIGPRSIKVHGDHVKEHSYELGAH